MVETKDEMSEAQWFAIQTYSGHENKVKSLLERKIAELGDEPEERDIREVIVPTREVVEIKGGKKVRSTKRLYPGYVLVSMVLNQESMFLITSTPSVIKFLGGGSNPQPLRDDEVNKILGVAEGGGVVAIMHCSIIRGCQMSRRSKVKSRRSAGERQVIDL